MSRYWVLPTRGEVAVPSTDGGGVRPDATLRWHESPLHHRCAAAPLSVPGRIA